MIAPVPIARRSIICMPAIFFVTSGCASTRLETSWVNVFSFRRIPLSAICPHFSFACATTSPLLIRCPAANASVRKCAANMFVTTASAGATDAGTAGSAGCGGFGSSGIGGGPSVEPTGGGVAGFSPGASPLFVRSTETCAATACAWSSAWRWNFCHCDL